MIKLNCFSCGKPFGVPGEQAGKRAKCPRCGAVNGVPADIASVDVHAPAAPIPVASPSASSIQHDVPVFTVDSHASHGQPFQRRRKSAVWPYVALAGGGVAVIAVVAILILSSNGTGGSDDSLALEPLSDIAVQECVLTERTVNLKNAERWKDKVKFSLVAGPPGAEIDERSGHLRWQPSEEQGPGQVQVTVRVADAASESVYVEQTFQITVHEVNQPPALEPISDVALSAGESMSVQAKASDTDFPAVKLQYSLAAGASSGAHIDSETGALNWTPAETDAGRTFQFIVLASEPGPRGMTARQSFNVQVKASDSLIATTIGEGANVSSQLDPHSGQPSFAGQSVGVATVAVTPLPETNLPQLPQPGAREEQGDQVLLDLYDKKKLFLPIEYPTLRRIYAERFERQHEQQIQQAFGADYEEMNAWLTEHRDIKEEFYTAIKAEYDDVLAALTIFKDLKQKFPAKIEPFANVAIAIAVTWDQPRGGVYDYRQHQMRTKSTLPEGDLDAAGNFQFLLDTERFMQGRGQFLPWEFLVLIVDHRTPVIERQWALSNYLPQRAMFGKCYADVPYDYEMLRTGSQQCQLGGKPYVLPNIRQFGGVCAMQADYAARVGKSMGVPAAYVRGESNAGDLHAWVMWVELLRVAPGSIGFSLESYGRYRGDQFYVGHLDDPQTGHEITDRELELRLHTVGINAAAKRQADLIMRSYPMLSAKRQMDVGARLRFLEQTITLSPGNEDAWMTVAKMSGEEEVKVKHSKQMLAVLDQLFRTFSNFPDFTWKIFDDLIAFQSDHKQRTKFYERLVMLYEQAGRPDLACEARLKLSDYHVTEGRPLDAVLGLAYTIKKFPSEGRYVPRMLDKLEQTCQGVEGADKELLAFYASFLPMIPQMRGDDPSKYCMAMFERGIERFKQFGQPQLAQLYEAQLAKIRAGQGRRS